MGSVSNLTDLLDCYDVDNNALITNSSVVGFGSSKSEWILGIGNFFWFFGFVVMDQSNWQVRAQRMLTVIQRNKVQPLLSPAQATAASKPGAGALGFILAGLAWMALSLGKIPVMMIMMHTPSPPVKISLWWGLDSNDNSWGFVTGGTPPLNIYKDDTMIRHKSQIVPYSTHLQKDITSQSELIILFVFIAISL